MTNPLITPRILRKNYVLPDELNECDSAIIGFLTFPADIERNLHPLKSKIVSLHDDRRQFYGEFQGKRFIVLDRIFGGAVISSAIEELVELNGVKRIIGIGLSGTLVERLKLGDFVLARSAVNSGGVAREYYPDGELLLANEIMISDYKSIVGSINTPYLSACAWTTEAIYREYPEKLQNWRAIGGEIVNMETSFLYAVCKKLNIPTIYICVISDYLFKTGWDYDFSMAENQTPKLFNLAVSALSNENA